MQVRVDMLGGFRATVDAVPVPDDAWSRRHAAALVKLLALTRGRRLHREQVIEALWPGASPDAAGPRLHKAAHYARRALGGGANAVVLRHDTVLLLPDDVVDVDVETFATQARHALAAASRPDAEAALERYRGPLLPADVYESWTEEQRSSLASLHQELLRFLGRWEDLVALDPLDEEAHLALARAAAARGDVRGALRQLERLDQALRRELGTTPGPEVQELRRSLQRPADAPPDRAAETATRLVGRRDAGDLVRRHLQAAEQGSGSTLLVTGPPGVGKTSVLKLAAHLARQRGWRVCRGTASAMEGQWPYASVLESIGDLCRQHPALLDGLDDNYRRELERALSAQEVSWSGESAHQRLFVAAAELLRLAGAGHGLLLLVDDLHEADQATLRLLHYLARCAVEEPVVLALGHRSTAGEALEEMQASLVSRGIGTRVELRPLGEQATKRLLAQQFPELAAPSVERIWTVSGGLPFTALELARAEIEGRPGLGGPQLPPAAQRTLQRVALLGAAFTTDELLAVAGVDEATAYAHLETALAALVVEPAEIGYRFRHALLRESLLASLPNHALAAARRHVADRLAEMGAAPGRIAHQYLAAGLPRQAIRHVLPAVETAGALGAYRDALSLVDAVLEHASGEDRAHLLARRGDLLMALGDPAAVEAYRQAVPVTRDVEHRLVRARLARAAIFRGDLETCRSALEGLGAAGDDADGPILLARGNFAYFTGDVDAAWDAASQARRILLTPDDPWHYVDLVSLQGLIAHERGEWFERFRLELRRTKGQASLATALFDAHLCVAEYLLYGPIPYPEVIELAEDLQRRAAHFGALRGLAFATALIGEAALLMGDLERAERELQEAVDLHREADASAGEAHSLQRLAEVRLAQGRPGEARSLLQAALPLARWSVMSMHLMQRIYGSMIRAAPDPWAARAVVDKAEATMGEDDDCPFCAVMLEVPATIACADVGDLDVALRHLEAAEASASRWEGEAWDAAVREAKAHVARAEGRAEESRSLLAEAEQLFVASGHPLDARRCRESVLRSGSLSPV
jgi:DNA-binding SARP family transcriptional activator/tetratricopeptide (TPR) repeat protein